MIGLEQLQPGQVLGRYELLMPVGQGGMAQVWAARLRGSRGFQKIVAIKVMLPFMMDEPEFERMFLDEASLASQIRHPHVIEILDLGEQAHVLYLVMEWVDGEPLNVIMRHAADRGGIPVAIAINITMQVCRGLHAAHELRNEDGALIELVHRDITPQNILVSYDGVVKIVDFGVAKATARVSAETAKGHLKGKLAYMSPEQLRGEEIDRRSDLFALGISLYMMTTGRHPFKGDNEAVTIGNIVSDDPVQPPHQLIQEYPKALESVVLRALDKDRRRRFATANDMLRALSMALPSRVPIGTEEEVASFLRSLLPDRLLQRKAIIKEALDAADQRISPEQPPRRLRSPFGADFSPPSLPGIYQMEGATLTGNAGTATLETVPEPPLSAKRRGRRMMIAGASLGVVGVATIVAMMLLPRASVDANNEAVVTAAPQMAQPAPRHEEPEPVVAVPVEQLAVVGAGDAGAPDAPAPRSRAKTRSSKPRNVSEPEKKSESGSTPFVSPVRSPGF